MNSKYLTGMKFIFLFFFFFLMPLNGFTEEDELFTDTLILDIDSTAYYDLVVWLDKLGLDTSGNIDDLRKKLYNYYELVPEIKKENNSSGRSIIIESARTLNYLKDITIDQNLIILEGQVVLKMIDPSNKTTHKIIADKIIFNQSEKTISASGNIQYEITGESNTELFYGESLVFEIESWEGIFFEGVSENDRLVDDKNISFFFSGDYIYRSSSDKIILNRGSITSKRTDDPYYRLDAEKIWVLQPGEWAIKNALLYVGRIPVLYIPFFFLPGDKLIFNPSVGYKEINGYFINTTTFLLGQKDNSDNNTFSFLKSNNSIAIMEKERNGLFLTTTDRPINTDTWPYSTGSSIKLLSDYYSRKGFFLALDGKLDFTGFIRKFNFFTAFSLSKYIFLDNNSKIYTPYRTNVAGDYISDYETTYFLGKKLPFRFAFDIDLDIGTQWMKFNLNLPVYSDGQFRLHFLNREEGLKWTEFLENTDKPTGVSENEMNNLLWNLQGSITPSTDSLAPFIEEILLKKINLQLAWQSSLLPFADNSLLNSNNYSVEDNLSFFFPSTLVIPDLSVSISGTIFTTGKNGTNADDNNIALEEILINPISDKINSSGLNYTEEILEKPAFLGSIPINSVNKNNNFSNILKYSIKPSMLINTIFNTIPPVQASDIGFKSDYSIFNSHLTSILDYSFNINDSMLTFSNKSIFTMNFKQHFNPTAVAGDWDSLLLQDKNATNYKISNDIILQSKPFSLSSLFSESIFNYSVNTIIYNRYFNQSSMKFENNYLIWDDTAVNNHRASLEFKYKTDNNYQILKFETILPPGTTEIKPEIVLTAGKITGSGKMGVRYREEGFSTSSQLWNYDPLFIYLKYSFLKDTYFKQSLSLDSDLTDNSFAKSELVASFLEEKLNFNQTLQMNIKNFALTESSTTLKLWFLNFNFLIEDVPGYVFSLSSGWIPGSNSKFQPSKASAGVDFSYTPPPLWKNRINLSLDLNSSWTMNLQKFTDTSFNFSLNFVFSIAEFLDFTFETISVNRATYRYIPGFSEKLNLNYINPIVDLVKSFNFFNLSDRLESNFNIETIGISAVHHMNDWDLSIKYSGKQDLVADASNKYEYKWKTDLSIFLTWRPIPEIKKKIDYSENEISFK